MTEPNGGPVIASSASASSGIADVSALDLENLVPGARWRSSYQIREQLPDITHGKVLSACHVGTGEEVLIRTFRVSDGRRASVWNGLARAAEAHLVGLREALEADGRRIEVVAAPPGKSLRVWASGRPQEPAALRSLVTQIAQALDVLHTLRLAHLNLSPDTVFVTESNGLALVVGGLESVTDFGVSALASVTVDPFYAPPEVAGLFQHHCDLALRAWDWWSVGRIIQELVLGKHVFGVMLGRDVTRRTPELLMKAEQMLRDKTGGTGRPGGVEVMGSVDSSINTLLRGLLSSSRDARWGGKDVAAWLRGEPVKERYHLPAHERLFVWKDRAYAVPEAAEYFAEAANWPDAITNVFGAQNPGTLAHFLGEDGTYRKLRDKVEDLVRLADTSTFAELPAGAVREVITSLALGVLAGGSTPLMLRGRKVDTACLLELLSPEAPPDGLPLVECLTQHAVVQNISQIDADAARLLGELDRNVSAALTMGARHHWLSRADRSAVARLHALVLAGDVSLRAAVADGHERFAGSRLEELDQLFKRDDLTLGERALVVFTLEASQKLEYVSHETWQAEQYARLHSSGEKIAVALTWLHLARALRVGPHLVGPKVIFALYWSAVAGCVALAFPSRITLVGGLVLLVLGVLLRLLVMTRARRNLLARLPETAGRARLPRVGECLEHARKTMALSGAPSFSVLKKSLRETNLAIGKIPVAKGRGPVTPPDRFAALLAASALSVFVTATLIGVLGWRIAQHPPTWPQLKTAWLYPPKPEIRAGDKIGLPADASRGTSGSAAIRDGSKGAGNSGETIAKTSDKAKDDAEPLAQISWPYRMPESAQQPRLAGTGEANKEQTHAAEAAGKALLKQYRPDSIEGMLAVHVPTETGFGVMLYDGRTAKVVDRRVFMFGYVPLNRAWLELGGKRAIYLGEN